MVVESVPLAHARASGGFLDQYLIACPVCAKAGAAHVEWTDGEPTLVRFVCLSACAVEPADVLASLQTAVEVGLTA
jgi:hypothetical protein